MKAITKGDFMTDIYLRKLLISDLDNYYELNKPTREYHKFNGPYFEKETEEELKIRVENIKIQIENNTYNNQSLMISNKENDDLIGQVSWHWKSIETNWMEIGIVIFNEDYWGKGIGYKALNMWVDMLFSNRDDIIRLGLTTWSGNKRMMKLAEKCGFILEARYRKARIVNGEYYDSVSYGILKEEWEQRKLKL